MAVFLPRRWWGRPLQSVTHGHVARPRPPRVQWRVPALAPPQDRGPLASGSQHPSQNPTEGSVRVVRQPPLPSSPQSAMQRLVSLHRQHLGDSRRANRGSDSGRAGLQSASGGMGRHAEAGARFTTSISTSPTGTPGRRGAGRFHESGTQVEHSSDVGLDTLPTVFDRKARTNHCRAAVRTRRSVSSKAPKGRAGVPPGWSAIGPASGSYNGGHSWLLRPLLHLQSLNALWSARAGSRTPKKDEARPTPSRTRKHAAVISLVRSTNAKERMFPSRHSEETTARARFASTQ